MLKTLFSFSGTLERGKFILYIISIFILLLILNFFFPQKDFSLESPTFTGLLGGFFLLWINLALFIKRGNSIGAPVIVTLLLFFLLAPLALIAYMIIPNRY